MALGESILTYFDGEWRQGNVPILGAADHATWLGTLVFDGARRFDGVSPDLDRHLQRVINSAQTMGMDAPIELAQMRTICDEGLARIPADQAVYIRPMMWSLEGLPNAIEADPTSTVFCLCLETLAMPAPDASATLGRTRYTRPTLAQATTDAKAACLYPNNARMLRETKQRGFSNAIVCDSLGNIAESATSNIFMVRDGEVFTPVPNGTFLNGITRQRIIALLREDGTAVHEKTLVLDDFMAADEVFLTGNISKVTPVTAIESQAFEHGRVAKRCRELYWDWALST